LKTAPKVAEPSKQLLDRPTSAHANTQNVFGFKCFCFGWCSVLSICQVIGQEG